MQHAAEKDDGVCVPTCIGVSYTNAPIPGRLNGARWKRACFVPTRRIIVVLLHLVFPMNSLMGMDYLLLVSAPRGIYELPRKGEI